jgi:hypothetical protein
MEPGRSAVSLQLHALCDVRLVRGGGARAPFIIHNME